MKYPLVHSLPHPTIHLRDYIEGIPLNAKVSSPWQTNNGISRVHSHCTSPENSVQAGCHMQTDTQANQCIPDASWSSVCQQTKILVPPWEPVLGGSCATLKCRLIWTTLGCVSCCAQSGHPRQPCISRLTIHRWHWGQCFQLLPWVCPSCPVLYGS